MNNKLQNLFTANNIPIVDMVVDESLPFYGSAEFSFDWITVFYNCTDCDNNKNNILVAVTLAIWVIANTWQVHVRGPI